LQRDFKHRTYNGIVNPSNAPQIQLQIIKEMTSPAVTAAINARKSNNYKQLKESFVSNLSGGSIWEINEGNRNRNILILIPGWI